MGEREQNQTQGGLNLSGVLSSFAEIVAQVKTPLGFLTAALGIVGLVLVCFLAWDSTPAERKPSLSALQKELRRSFRRNSLSVMPLLDPTRPQEKIP